MKLSLRLREATELHTRSQIPHLLSKAMHVHSAHGPAVLGSCGQKWQPSCKSQWLLTTPLEISPHHTLQCTPGMSVWLFPAPPAVFRQSSNQSSADSSGLALLLIAVTHHRADLCLAGGWGGGPDFWSTCSSRSLKKQNLYQNLKLFIAYARTEVLSEDQAYSFALSTC